MTTAPPDNFDDLSTRRIEFARHVFMVLVSNSLDLRAQAEAQGVHISNELALELLTKIFLKLFGIDEGELL